MLPQADFAENKFDDPSALALSPYGVNTCSKASDQCPHIA